MHQARPIGAMIGSATRGNAKITNRIAGSLLIAAGAGMAVLRRR
jgi:hypothetical protein